MAVRSSVDARLREGALSLLVPVCVVLIWLSPANAVIDARTGNSSSSAPSLVGESCGCALANVGQTRGGLCFDHVDGGLCLARACGARREYRCAPSGDFLCVVQTVMRQRWACTSPLNVTHCRCQQETRTIAALGPESGDDPEHFSAVLPRAPAKPGKQVETSNADSEAEPPLNFEWDRKPQESVTPRPGADSDAPITLPRQPAVPSTAPTQAPTTPPTQVPATAPSQVPSTPTPTPYVAQCVEAARISFERPEDDPFEDYDRFDPKMMANVSRLHISKRPMNGPALYETTIWSLRDFSYTVAGLNDSMRYVAQVHLREIRHCNKPNQRIVDIGVGDRIFKAVDVFETVGCKEPLMLTTEVTSEDGRLRFTFMKNERSEQGGPEVAAIDVFERSPELCFQSTEEDMADNPNPRGTLNFDEELPTKCPCVAQISFDKIEAPRQQISSLQVTPKGLGQSRFSIFDPDAMSATTSLSLQVRDELGVVMDHSYVTAAFSSNDWSYTVSALNDSKSYIARIHSREVDFCTHPGKRKFDIGIGSDMIEGVDVFESVGCLVDLQVNAINVSTLRGSLRFSFLNRAGYAPALISALEVFENDGSSCAEAISHDWVTKRHPLISKTLTNAPPCKAIARISFRKNSESVDKFEEFNWNYVVAGDTVFIEEGESWSAVLDDHFLSAAYSAGEFAYIIPSLDDNKKYVARIHLRDGRATAPDSRVFDIRIGDRIVSDIDIYNSVGRLRPLTVTFKEVVSKRGRLQVRFIPKKGEPIVASMELFESDGSHCFELTAEDFSVFSPVSEDYVEIPPESQPCPVVERISFEKERSELGRASFKLFEWDNFLSPSHIFMSGNPAWAEIMDPLYVTAAFSTKNFAYSLRGLDDSKRYIARLHTREGQFCSKSGTRVFSVAVGDRLISDIDIFDMVGCKYELSLDAKNVRSSSGELIWTFLHHNPTKGDPIVSAIELFEYADGCQESYGKDLATKVYAPMSSEQLCDKSKQTPFPLWNGTPSGRPQSFGRVPEAGVHPRIFFGPEELPRLRKLLLDPSAVCADKYCHKPKADVDGAAGFLYLKMRIRKGRFNSPLMGGKSRESKMYGLLKTGDTGWRALAQLKSLGKYIGVDQAAYGGQGIHGLYGLISGAAFVSLIQEDSDFNRKDLSTALCSLCQLHKRFYRQVNNDNFHHDAQVDLGLAYDFLASSMSEDQRKPCRELIMSMIQGRSEYGQSSGYLEQPWSWNWNHVGWHQHIVVLALSIYGEPETNNEPQRFLDECLEVQEIWWHNDVTEAGYGREEIYYFNLGTLWSNPAQVALARYGPKYNLVQNRKLGNSRIYRQLLYHFYTKTMTSTYMSWSGGNRPACSQVMWNYLFPEDPIAVYIVRNAHFKPFWEENTLQMVMFATQPMPVMSYQEVAESKRLPLSFFCRDRGRMITRSDWGENAMTLDFELRLDAHRAGHIAPHPNTFFIYALNLPWIVKFDLFTDGWEGASSILIDNVGVAGHESPKTHGMLPGVWNEYRHDETGITLGSGDAKWPYSYEKHCIDRTKCVKNPGFSGLNFSYAPNPFCEEWMDTPLFNEHLTVINPVLYAHRTALLDRRLGSPYTFVVDDYKKDDKIRKYEWFVNLPAGDFQLDYHSTVSPESESENEVILRHDGEEHDKIGSPRFLVRLLDYEGEITDKFRFAIQRVRDARLGHYKTRRVVTVSTRATKTRFKTFFFAFRKGERLPTTRYDAENHQLSVGIGNAIAQLGCEPNDDGRTRIQQLAVVTPTPSPTPAPKLEDCSACSLPSQCVSDTCLSIFDGPQQCGSQTSQVQNGCATLPICEPCEQNRNCESGKCASLFGGRQQCGDLSAQVDGGCLRLPVCQPCNADWHCLEGVCASFFGEPRRCGGQASQVLQGCLKLPDCQNCVADKQCSSEVCVKVSSGPQQCGTKQSQVAQSCATLSDCDSCVDHEDCESGVCNAYFGGEPKCGDQRAQAMSECLALPNCEDCSSPAHCSSGTCASYFNSSLQCGNLEDQLNGGCLALPDCEECSSGIHCRSQICAKHFGVSRQCGTLASQLENGCQSLPTCHECSKPAHCSSGVCRSYFGGRRLCGNLEMQLGGGCTALPACELCQRDHDCLSGICSSHFGGSLRCGNLQLQLDAGCSSLPDCHVCAASTECASGICSSHFGGASFCGSLNSKVKGGCTLLPDCEPCLTASNCLSGACTSYFEGPRVCGSLESQLEGGCTKLPVCEPCETSQHCASSECTAHFGGPSFCGGLEAQLLRGCTSLPICHECAKKEHCDTKACNSFFDGKKLCGDLESQVAGGCTFLPDCEPCNTKTECSSGTCLSFFGAPRQCGGFEAQLASGCVKLPDCEECDSAEECQSKECRSVHGGRRLCGTLTSQLSGGCARLPICVACSKAADCSSGTCSSFFGGPLRCGNLAAQVKEGCTKLPACKECDFGSECDLGQCESHFGKPALCGALPAQLEYGCTSLPDCESCINAKHCSSGICESFYGGPRMCGNLAHQVEAGCVTKPVCEPCAVPSDCESQICSAYYGGSKLCGNLRGQMEGGCTLLPDCEECAKEGDCQSKVCESHFGETPKCGNLPSQLSAGCTKLPSCSPCSHGSQCSAGVCSTHFGGQSYCGTVESQLKEGCLTLPDCERCSSSSECRSNMCTSYFGAPGLCGSLASQVAKGCTRLRTCEECSKSVDCAAGVCDSYFQAPRRCGSLQEQLAVGCLSLPVCEECTHDSDCVDKTCSARFGGPTLCGSLRAQIQGGCRTLPVCEECTADSECSSGRCLSIFDSKRRCGSQSAQVAGGCATVPTSPPKPKPGLNTSWADSNA